MLGMLKSDFFGKIINFLVTPKVTCLFCSLEYKIN